MDRALDRSLDDILGDRKQNNRGPRGGGRRRDRPEYPRDGVRKSFRDDASSRNLDSEWVHDKFEDYGNRRSGPRRRQSPDPPSDSRGSKLRVDNIHYELTQEDLEGLFSRIGPLVSLDMKYDRAGRSEGTAFVTYESNRDAAQAIKEFDGANAAGQPIRLTLLPTGPSRRNNNPFDSATAGAGAGRPLAERITVPGQGRSRSLSPRRGGGGRESDEEAARRGVDRYRPRGGGGGGGSGRLSRSRSPIGGGRRRDGGGGGRRPGARREGGGGRGRGERGGGGGGGDRGERGGRPKKTQEELDAEMEDYFGGGGSGGGGGAQQSEGAAGGVNGVAAQQQQQQQDLGEDIDMIE
ncbi:hypothetical protein C8A01DRAFT_32165 [Parachaetomium inaequale]|uniref:RRM domain-containing protein n=1 Tax=Parachaetomium inaequale TaxID=2588326 RepID=A0AAN6SV17_9PEZI|nr:hypothetical protein C8A01DRAFT_32165 [Parachaetomium inaequale]